jgi:SAM-dependent methyltransferase
MNGFIYAGKELELFARAMRWKSYFASQIRPFLRGEVLEVGAGIGGTTRVLCDDPMLRWTCLEPDFRMASALMGRVRELPGAAAIDVRVGTLADLEASRRFDCILYIDVLEHIEDDAAEMARAAARLRPGGRIVVLAPAHEALYSEFDASVDHYRRYDRRTLRGVMRGAMARDAGLACERLIYLDSVGLLLSLANRVFLRRAMPTMRDILFWDRVCVPVSRIVDRWIGHRVGKTVLGVWRRADVEEAARLAA